VKYVNSDLNVQMWSLIFSVCNLAMVCLWFCRWLGCRLEFLGAIVVFTAALFAVIGRGIMSASIVGLAISYALQVCCWQCHVMLLSTQLAWDFYLSCSVIIQTYFFHAVTFLDAAFWVCKSVIIFCHNSYYLTMKNFNF